MAVSVDLPRAEAAASDGALDVLVLELLELPRRDPFLLPPEIPHHPVVGRLLLVSLADASLDVAEDAVCDGWPARRSSGLRHSEGWRRIPNARRPGCHRRWRSIGLWLRPARQRGQLSVEDLGVERRGRENEQQKGAERLDGTHHGTPPCTGATARHGCRAVATVTHGYGESPAYSLGRGERPHAGHVKLLYSAGDPTYGNPC